MTALEDLIWLFTSDSSSRGIVRLNIAEGALLYKYCKKVKNGTLLEIGRKHGGSTVLIASVLESGFLYSIDIVLHPQVKKYIKSYKDKVKLITGDSKVVEWNMPIDLLFIDGDHSYKGVKNDINKFASFINSNGFLILHDVVGKKSILQPLINKVLDDDWKYEAKADSMLILKRT